MTNADDTGPTAPRGGDALLWQFVGYRMKRIWLMIQDDMTRTLEPFGLRTGTFSALAVVIANPGISQSDLSDALRIKRSGIVALVDELEQAGVLRRSPVKGDRRTNALTVTENGRQLWDRVEQAVRAHEDGVFGHLDTAEMDQLRTLTERIYKRPDAV